ncbi:hypothetical protein HMN09_00491500 [Mycena chlorophos]|uniref:DUF7730 domain-containing protein n=1 Tax=Mycena chlorophos TaxID=658473 RepID=A0A8H6T938_MYCCL|nr:hypothetical protein HMN09_00491500 [Mycena chlorophos]
MAPTLKSVSQRALRVLQVALVFTILGPCILFQWGVRGGRGCVRKSPPIVYPPPLPTKRVDISKTPPATPAKDCHILNLPQELRLMILEDLLGGRIMELWPVANGSKPCRISSAGLTTNSDGSLARTKYPGIAILKTCRQLYLEGLPIWHRKNTYYFDMSDFPQLFLAALGLYCISNIRHLYLVVSSDSLRYDGDPERAVGLLHMMQLETLHINFELLFRFDEVVKFMALDGDWAPGILAIRGLRAFEVRLPERVRALEQYPWETEQVQLATQLVADYRALMVGPKAEEKYLAFLKDRAEHGAAA